MRTLTRISTLIASVVVVAAAGAQPQYQIFDIGVIQAGDTASQGFGASPGGIAVGRSITSNSASQAFTWTEGGGRIALPNLAGRPHAVSNDANDKGIVVGTAATTLFGSSRLPVVWTNGVVSQLPLPAGETIGDANGVNGAGVAVGSVDGGTLQQAVIYDGGTATVITQTTPDGSFFLTAFGINNSGRIVGQGIDPNNAARNVGIVYDMGSPAAFEVGALFDTNGALAFGVGNGGHVVGSTMMNQGSGKPFIWSHATGMVAIPLATGTTEGSARAVNTAGWVVGQDSSAFSIPFLWDGTTTYRLADLLPPGSGWDLSTNTSSSALGISDNGVIVGTGVHNGETHAYAMVPVLSTPSPTPSPTPCGLITTFSENFDGVVAPALPAGWTTSFTPGPANCTPTGTCALGTNWATTTNNPDTPPNCAFHDAPACVTDSILETPTFTGGPTNGAMLFLRHSYDLASGLDGAVLEISINGGPFVDFVAAGGGSLYNGTISSGTLNPLAGRSAWTGNSGGYTEVIAHMPVSSAGQNVRLRFRLATDCSGSSTGWRIDTIAVRDNIGCPSPTPTPTPSPTPPVTPTPANCVIISLNESFDTVTPPDLPAGWVSSFTPGPANCTPVGTCASGTQWTTNSAMPISGPNSAFHDAPACVTDSKLDTPHFTSPTGANLTFDQSYNLESGSDGAVLEVSIDGGPFVDFVAAGGSFMSGGYNGTISGTTFNPLAGRQAWTGTSNASVFARMPDATGQGHNTVLRFRLGTDCSGGSPGWRIDNVKVIFLIPCDTPTPTPATPTPSPTGTPSPSPAPTCTPVPVFTADFDGVTAPALPAGWITTFTPGAANCTPIGTCALGTDWATSTTNPFSPPNSAFHNAPGCVTDSTLDTPSFVSGTLSTSLIFHHRYDLEDGLDGGVLEISINGGAFTDIIAAGGQFVNPGAYNGTISAGSLNPIAGRQAWTGNSGGYIQSRVEFPPSALFQPVRLRFRLATGCSGAGTGWWIDSISVTYPPGCPTPPPSPSPSVTPPPTTPTPSPTVTPPLTPSTTPSEPHFEVSAPSSVIAGFPFDITVTAKIFGNVFTNYTGTVHFTTTSTGLGTQLPPDSTLTNGVGTFSVTLGSLGFQTITATDTVNPSMTGTSGSIRVDLKPPGSPTPSPTATPPPTPTPTPVAQALNLSTRMRVQTGENVGIGGFIITGTAPKHVLLRAIGPSLSPALSNVLADPVMELHGPSPFVTIVNDNWRDDPAQEALIIASGIPPTNNAESAIDATLPSGSYTAIVSGKNNSSGVGLVEAYDLDQAAASKLSNISTRAFVETGEDVVIAGFILGGSNGSDRVIVRGLGPSLTAAGVADALADPTLELRDSNGALLASNNNWHDDPTQAAELIASGLAPTNDLEAAIAATLPPGPFTVLLAGANNGIGVGLVEVYDRGAP